MASLSPEPPLVAKEFPILYGLDRHGKMKMWKAVVYSHHDHTASSIIEFGYLNGEHQFANRVYTEGKNIGKKNETTPLQQCIAETNRKWMDKREKESYHEDNKVEDKKDNKENTEKKDEAIFPMLAHTYEPHTQKKKKNDIIFPCLVQPKLDGLRCVTYKSKNGNNILFQSRTGSYFETMSHIAESLSPLFQKYPDLILDGELYTTEIPFEELAGLIKKRKLTSDDHQRLKKVYYHVYDIIPLEDTPFSERDSVIGKLLNSKNSYTYVEKVKTMECLSIEDFKILFSEFVADGYEGIMLRNGNGMYQQGHRSHDLQKYKEFLEEEFTITGFREGDGRDKETVIWICVTEEGREFSVRPKGNIEYRKDLFSNGREYIGKKLTVIFQEKSQMGVPRFPVGKSIRENF
jgi:DNA ligase-1